VIARRELMLSTALAYRRLAATQACSHAIGRIQAQVNARLEAKAGGGPVAPESSGALPHHRPTPGSIATAERGAASSPANGRSHRAGDGTRTSGVKDAAAKPQEWIASPAFTIVIGTLSVSRIAR